MDTHNEVSRKQLRNMYLDFFTSCNVRAKVVKSYLSLQQQANKRN